MTARVHLTSGDRAGERLRDSGLSGEVFVWHDVLYDGRRQPGWPDDASIEARACFLEAHTGGGLSRVYLRNSLRAQYGHLRDVAAGPLVLWFDACLFDQAMLAHILACLDHVQAAQVELVCIDACPGLERYDGLGQLTPEQMAARFGDRSPVTAEQRRYACLVDRSFASGDTGALLEIARTRNAPLPWMPAAAARWLEELPDATTGLGKLARLTLAAIREGQTRPAEILASVAEADSRPRYWGDTTLWGTINDLAARQPAFVTITGPTDRLPQWPGNHDIDGFRVWPSGTAQPGSSTGGTAPRLSS
jgi:hypothetical protein